MVTKDYSKSRMRENRTYGSARGGQSNLIPSTRLTGLWPEGFGIALLTAPLALRVLKIDGALAPKVLRFDGPSARGLWYRRFAAMSMKSALRDCLLCQHCCITECYSLPPQEGGVAVGNRG